MEPAQSPQGEPAPEPAAADRMPKVKLAAKVPYPDGRGGSIPFSAIEFSFYDNSPAEMDEDAAVAALQWFHNVVRRFYEYSYNCRAERNATRAKAEPTGRPVAALVPETADSF